MSKVNPNSYQRPVAPPIPKTFIDPDEPGWTLPMVFRKLSVAETLAAAGLGGAMFMIYGEVNGEQPHQFLPVVGGQRVIVSEAAANAAAVLFYAQMPPSEEDKYTWDEIVSHMVRDQVCIDMSLIAQELQPKEKFIDPLARKRLESQSTPIAPDGTPPASPPSSTGPRIIPGAMPKGPVRLTNSSDTSSEGSSPMPSSEKSIDAA